MCGKCAAVHQGRKGNEGTKRERKGKSGGDVAKFREPPHGCHDADPKRERRPRRPLKMRGRSGPFLPNRKTKGLPAQGKGKTWKNGQSGFPTKGSSINRVREELGPFERITLMAINVSPPLVEPPSPKNPTTRVAQVATRALSIPCASYLSSSPIHAIDDVEHSSMRPFVGVRTHQEWRNSAEDERRRVSGN